MSVQVGYAAGGALEGMRPQFRLRPGQDDVLIEWLASLAPRRRSQAIRDALFRYVTSRTRAEDSAWGEDPDLAAALDSLF